MKTEEELLADFINKYHSDEAMEIATDPLLYIYYRDSSDFACYKVRCAMLDLKHTIDTIFKISVSLNTCMRFLNKIMGKKESDG